MLGADTALGVLEQAMRAALARAGAWLLEAVLAGEETDTPGRMRSAAAATRPSMPPAGTRP